MAYDFHPFLCPADERASIDRRLAGLSVEAIYSICLDPCESLYTRFYGTFQLAPADQKRVLDVLLNKSDDLLWTALGLVTTPTDSPEARAVLWRHAIHGVDEYRVRALHFLAKLGDARIVDVASELLASDDGFDRGVGLACLKFLNRADGLKPVRAHYSNESSPIDSRVKAAEILLKAGDFEPLSFLVETAQRDTSRAAYYATLAVYRHHDKRQGYALMRGILDSPSHEGHRFAVMHVANWMGDHSIAQRPGALEAARQWLDERLQTS